MTCSCGLTTSFPTWLPETQTKQRKQLKDCFPFLFSSLHFHSQCPIVTYSRSKAPSETFLNFPFHLLPYFHSSLFLSAFPFHFSFLNLCFFEFVNYFRFIILEQFRLSVQSKPVVLGFCFNSQYDLSLKLAPASHQIRFKTKTNHDFGQLRFPALRVVFLIKIRIFIGRVLVVILFPCSDWPL